jgi:DNA-binding CsgD family transcriptional regulator
MVDEATYYCFMRPGENGGDNPLGSALRGREAEWQRISDLLERVLAGESAVLLLEGRPGTGKTRLLQELVAAAGPAGFSVVSCDGPFGIGPGPSTRSAPGPVIPRQLRRSPQPRPPELSGPPPPYWPTGQATPGAIDAQGPLLIIHDDAQWADMTRMPMLPQAGNPKVCVLAYRPGAGGGPLGSLLMRADESTVRIELGPLSEAAVGELVTDLVGAAPRPDLRAMAARAAGNPLLVTGLINGLREEAKLDYGGDAVGLRSTVLPGRITAIVQQQLNELSPRSRQLLHVGSALGVSFALNDVAEMLRETTASLLPALEEALSAGVLICNSKRLTFSSELVWQVVKESLPAAVRGELDREAGLLLVSRGDTGLAPAGGLGPAAATEPTDPDGLSQVVTAVDSHLASGHLASAAALAEGALSRPVPPLFAAELHSRLAHILLMGGRADQAVIAAEQPLRDAALPPHIRENAEAARILALSLRGQAAAVSAADAVLADHSRRDGDPAVVTAATVLANVRWDSGDLAGSVSLARRAVAGIRATTPSSWRTNARLALARRLSNRREFAAAEALIHQVEADVDQYGLTLHSAAPAVARAHLLAQAGRSAEARAEAMAALAAAKELGAALLVPLAASVLAFVTLRAGDLLAAAEYVRRYRAELASNISPLWSVLYDWVELLLAAEQEGPRRAVELLTHQYSWIPTRPVLFAEEPGAAAWVVRTALAVGDHDLAHATVATIEALARDNPDFVAIGMAAVHARGLVERDVDALGRAAGGQPDQWAKALAAEDLAAHLELRADGSTRAVAAFEAALRTFEEIGAQRDGARIRSRLRAFGVRRRPALLPKYATIGWESLSDTERTISHLVNQGLTNRQIAKRVFLSPHTVNYHLRQIFRKLDVTSRVELARVTQEHCALLDDPSSSPPAPGPTSPGPISPGPAAPADALPPTGTARRSTG